MHGVYTFGEKCRVIIYLKNPYKISERTRKQPIQKPRSLTIMYSIKMWWYNTTNIDICSFMDKVAVTLKIISVNWHFNRNRTIFALISCHNDDKQRKDEKWIIVIDKIENKLNIGIHILWLHWPFSVGFGAVRVVHMCYKCHAIFWIFFLFHSHVLTAISLEWLVCITFETQY